MQIYNNIENFNFNFNTGTSCHRHGQSVSAKSHTGKMARNLPSQRQLKTSLRLAICCHTDKKARNVGYVERIPTSMSMSYLT